MIGSPSRRPPRSFFERDAADLARELLGHRLVSIRGGRRTSGVIVETEAYLGERDKAAHTYGGRRTSRNEAMWGPAGHAYVYFVYGMHHCVNVVAGDEGDPVAVLIRALEPIGGLETMRERRGGRSDRELCSGPAKLCQAMAIDRKLDGLDLVDGELLWVEQATRAASEPGAIESGPRIGIDYAEEWRDEPLRFWVADNPHVSR